MYEWGNCRSRVTYLIGSLYKRNGSGQNRRIVIINLSNNDASANRLASNLDHMIKLSLAEGIQPILVLEPNSVEMKKEYLLANHKSMRGVGKSHKVPVIDMHDYLRKEQDKGFLWWDSVHLTDFGQKLFAERLYEELLPLTRRYSNRSDD